MHTQLYYLSRANMRLGSEKEDFMETRNICLEKIQQSWAMENNSRIFDIDNELWTLKKILRRFIWHDRIHAKAITRILEKQRQLGIINGYEDPYCFREI